MIFILVLYCTRMFRQHLDPHICRSQFIFRQIAIIRIWFLQSSLCSPLGTAGLATRRSRVRSTTACGLTPASPWTTSTPSSHSYSAFSSPSSTQGYFSSLQSATLSDSSGEKSGILCRILLLLNKKHCLNDIRGVCFCDPHWRSGLILIF